MKVSIPTKVFIASQHCTASKDVRYYLNGVNLRLSDGTSGQVYSTDGHVLFAASFDIEYTDDSQIDDCKGLFDIIIPVVAVKHAAKIKSNYVILESLDNGSYALAGLQFQAIDGVFPDVARVIPDSKVFDPDNTPGQFDPTLLVRCQKALAAWHNSKAVYPMYHQGDKSCAVIQHDNTAICVVMPIRVDAGSQPWGFTVKTEPLAKAS